MFLIQRPVSVFVQKTYQSKGQMCSARPSLHSGHKQNMRWYCLLFLFFCQLPGTQRLKRILHLIGGSVPFLHIGVHAFSDNPLKDLRQGGRLSGLLSQGSGCHKTEDCTNGINVGPLIQHTVRSILFRSRAAHCTESLWGNVCPPAACGMIKINQLYGAVADNQVIWL